MPAGFRFVLRFGVLRRNEYDSATGRFVVDRVCDPSDTLIVRLRPAEVDTIWRTLATLRFFDYPAELLPDPASTYETDRFPDRLADLTVYVGERSHEVSWHIGQGPYTVHDAALAEFVWSFIRHLWATPEFRALSRVRCRYE